MAKGALAGWGFRWWVYQRERFPLLAHGPLVLAFSFSAVCYSRLLRGAGGWPGGAQLAVAFLTSLIFFAQLRIADEFKDREEDARYRPYRPVPRGLVTLRELGWLGAAGAAAQLALALWLYPPLVLLLAVTWLYLAGMSAEFFAREWLIARPVTYLWTHMLIMPLIDLYATSCDWLAVGGTAPPAGLGWFLLVSFCNGVLIEFGRKLRAPGDEEEGVPTYSRLWGVRGGAAAWAGALALNVTGALFAAKNIGFLGPAALLLGLLTVAALAVITAFARRPSTRSAKRVEAASGLWTLALYLTLGPLPLALRFAGWE